MADEELARRALEDKTPKAICYLYALSAASDPKHFRYVGQTKSLPSVRLQQHLSSRNRHKWAFYAWLRDMKDRGEEVIITVLKEDADWNKDEREAISRLRAEGHDLLNITVGGAGTKGLRHTAEVCEQRRQRMLGSTLSAETKQKLSKVFKERPLPPAFVAAINTPKPGVLNAFYGKHHKLEARLANAKAHAKLSDDEVRRARALRQQGRTQDSLAAEFGISSGQMCHLLHRKTYWWVD